VKDTSWAEAFCCND